MEELNLNETPIRTCKNFNINNVKLKDICIPEEVDSFNNVKIINNSNNINITNVVDDFKLVYGINDLLQNQIQQEANEKYKIEINSKLNKEIVFDFRFDNKNMQLIDNLEIIANENTKATIIVRYTTDCNLEYYHNGLIRTLSKENSDLNIIIVNFLNEKSNHFLSIESKCEKASNLKYTIIDFGGKNSITNYYSDLIGKEANNILNTIYLGKQDQFFDLNYIAELRGEKSNVNIEVQGALKDESKKHFKGTIDFKKGCKKAKGNENESCMLLSDKAKSIALPMLLCSEEDVEGNHSTSSGRVGEKELFYIMSRGFDIKSAIKLLVRANFNKILENIQNEQLIHQIIEEIDKRLD